MSEKKGLFSSLFGSKKQSNCCNIEIIEEPKCDCSGTCTSEEEADTTVNDLQDKNV